MVQQIDTIPFLDAVERMPEETGDKKTTGRPSTMPAKQFKGLIETLHETIGGPYRKAYERIARQITSQKGKETDRLLWAIRWYHQRNVRVRLDLYEAAEAALLRAQTKSNGNGGLESRISEAEEKEIPAAAAADDRDANLPATLTEQEPAAPVEEKWVPAQSLHELIERMHGINNDPDYLATYTQIVEELPNNQGLSDKHLFQSFVGGIRWHHQHNAEVRDEIYSAATRAYEKLASQAPPAATTHAPANDNANPPPATAGPAEPAQYTRKPGRKKARQDPLPLPSLSMPEGPKHYRPDKNFEIGDRLYVGEEGLIGQVIAKPSQVKIRVKMHESGKTVDLSYTPKRR